MPRYRTVRFPTGGRIKAKRVGWRRFPPLNLLPHMAGAQLTFKLEWKPGEQKGGGNPIALQGVYEDFPKLHRPDERTVRKLDTTVPMIGIEPVTPPFTGHIARQAGACYYTLGDPDGENCEELISFNAISETTMFTAVSGIVAGTLFLIAGVIWGFALAR